MSAKASIPLWQWSAAGLAQAIRERRVSSEEVVAAHLDRIAAVNNTVNAVTVVLDEDALRAAREADRKVAAGEIVGPLHGVPITIKENIDLVGTATTHGIVDLKDSFPDTDAPVVAHLKGAGAIPIGRTRSSIRSTSIRFVVRVSVTSVIYMDSIESRDMAGLNTTFAPATS